MMGGFGFGPIGGANQAGSGLPFSGIPAEYQEQVDGLLANEPEIEAIVVEFDHVERNRQPFTLRQYLTPHIGALAIGILDSGIMHVGHWSINAGRS